jgi:acetyl-CoA carboxylase biotin carboxyl carrier protein
MPGAAPQAMTGDVIGELCRHAVELVKADGGIRRVRLQAGDTVVELEWPEPAAPAAAGPGLTGQAPPAARAGEETTSSDAAEEAERGHPVGAPVVGTFYRAPEPGAPPFVAVGDVVEKGQQIGIVEAMKLMNPVEADRRGRVLDILVPDGTHVEYGEPLLVLDVEEAP